MATANIILRGNNPDKPKSITHIFRYENTHLKYSTGYRIEEDDWNEDKQEIRNRASIIDRDIINGHLLELRSKVFNAYHNPGFLGADIGIESIAN